MKIVSSQVLRAQLLERAVLYSSVLRTVFILGLIVTLSTACEMVVLEPDAPPEGSIGSPTSPLTKDNQYRSPDQDIAGALAEQSHRQAQRSHGFVQEGNDKFTKKPEGARGSVFKQNQAENNSAGVTLNLVNVPIIEAAKTILGDTLGLDYLVDPNISGNITVRTTNPVPVQAVADIFDAVLRANGAAIVDDRSGVFKVVPASQALASLPSLTLTSRDLGRRRIGVGVHVVPLKYTPVAEMLRILQPIAPKGSILQADETRNLLLLYGTRRELAAVMETIEIFDVDWMKSMSFALISLQTSDPEVISTELKTIFSASNTKDNNAIIRFIPNKRLQSILVIASRKHYLDKAKTWIDRLDAAVANTERQLYVYAIQNRTAVELSGLLQQVFAGQSTGVKLSSSVAPRFEKAKASSPGSDKNGPKPAPPSDVPISFQEGPNAKNGDDRVHIVADEANNAILIYASSKNYQRILNMLANLDTAPNQVLIAATIAEVSLSDELKFGLRWFLEQGSSKFTFTNLETSAIASVFPGFSYAFAGGNAGVILDALSGVTNINVISSPTLMVLDNRTAELQVGDQVPIATQTVTGTTSDAKIVNTIKLHDTGVILSVTPRVNDSGRVILDIEQEVSSVVKTNTSGIDSPTIQQRKIKTTVVVNDGEGLALGGLIQQRHTDTRTKIPIVGDIPLIGTLFRSKTDKAERTELLILITPRVVRDHREAQHVTSEFRRQLNLEIPEIRMGRQPAAAEARRILY